jgi:hypothetical protein
MEKHIDSAKLEKIEEFRTTVRRIDSDVIDKLTEIRELWCSTTPEEMYEKVYQVIKDEEKTKEFINTFNDNIDMISFYFGL